MPSPSGPLARAAVLATAAAVLLLPAAAPAAKLPKVPKIKTRIAKVQIEVKGSVETKLLHDTTSDCWPGESWTQTNRYDFSTGGFVNVSMKRVTGDGFDPIVTSPFTAARGSATVEGSISGYRTTNHCPPSAPATVRPAPTCAKHTGRTAISLQEGVLPKLDDDDLAPLTSAPLLIVVQRRGGGIDPTECLGTGALSLKGTDVATAVATTSPAPAISEILPSGYSVMKMFNIRPGQRLRKTVLLSGPCTSVTVRHANGSAPAPGHGSRHADGDCTLSGRLAFTIRPRPTR